MSLRVIITFILGFALAFAAGWYLSASLPHSGQVTVHKPSRAGLRTGSVWQPRLSIPLPDVALLRLLTLEVAEYAGDAGNERTLPPANRNFKRIGQGHIALAVTALRMALVERQPGPGLVHHSDRGVQYAPTNSPAIADLFDLFSFPQ